MYDFKVIKQCFDQICFSVLNLFYDSSNGKKKPSMQIVAFQHNLTQNDETTEKVQPPIRDLSTKPAYVVV